MSTEIDDKYKNIFKELVVRLNITDVRNFHILALSIEYANISDYTEEPKNKNEQIYNDIFIVKCKYFYQRKMIEFRKDIKINDINNIKSKEAFEVATLRGLIVPPPINLKKLMCQ